VEPWGELERESLGKIANPSTAALHEGAPNAAGPGG
jgi:hypothetical protein